VGAFGSARATLTFAQFDAQEFGQDGDAARNLFFVEAGEAQAQRVGQWRLYVEIATGSEEDAALAGVDHEFAGIESGRQFEPEAHAAFGTSPAGAFGHEFAQRLIESLETIGIDLAHAGEMFVEEAATQEFREGGLRELIGVEIGHLLDEPKALDSRGRGNDPADAKAGECNLGEAVHVNDEIGLIELFERRNADITSMETSVDVIFDNWNLMERGEFENAAARIERHGSAGGIVKIGSEDDELDAIGGEQGFENFQIDAERLAGLGMRANGDAEAARANAVENGGSARVGGILHDDGVAGTNKGFGN